MADALEGQPDTVLEESEACLVLTTAVDAAVAAADAGAVAVADHLLPPPQLGLRGALTGQKASLGCRLSQASVQLCIVFVQSICAEYLRRLLAITFKREFPNQRVLRNL